MTKIEFAADVLDHGSVRVVDYMGDDSAVVQAARVSYGKGTKTVNEDRGLLRYLMRHKHTTPFEMCTVKFHVKMPIFVARQWHRHRTASINEYSGRYSEMKNETYLPAQERVQGQDNVNKQGSGEALPLVTAQQVVAGMKVEQKVAHDNYKGYLGVGMSKELARINLPLSQYTEFYWQMNVHNLLHFLSLRLDSHAQLEIRAYAVVMAMFVKEWMPHTWEAFEDYKLSSTTLNKTDIAVLKWLLSLPHPVVAIDLENSTFFNNAIINSHVAIDSNTELAELKTKLMTILGE